MGFELWAVGFELWAVSRKLKMKDSAFFPICVLPFFIGAEVAGV